MKGFAVNQNHQYVTIKLDTDYEFSAGEPAEVNSLKMTFFDELLALYWVLIGWVVSSGAIWELPEDDRKYFNKLEPKALLKDKLYYLIRWRTGHTKTGYDKDGNPTEEVKSVSKRETKQNELSKHYDDAVQYFADRIDLTGFNVQHQAARERLGKFY
jgi:hypothetical protein